MQEFYSLSIPRMVNETMGDDLLKNRLERLPDLTITTFIQEAATESIINFKYRGFNFSADNGYLIWSFKVEMGCPEEIKEELRGYLKQIVINLLE